MQKIVETQRHNVPKKKRTPGTALSLFDRLYDCYVECTQKQSDKNFDKVHVQDVVLIISRGVDNEMDSKEWYRHLFHTAISQYCEPSATAVSRPHPTIISG